MRRFQQNLRAAALVVVWTAPIAAGCPGPEPRTAVAPAVSAPSTTPSTPTASSAPPAVASAQPPEDPVAILQRLLAKDTLLSPPAPWKHGDHRAAFAIDENNLLWPFAGEDKKWVLATSTLVPITKVLGPVVFRDLDGDGKPELVFFVTNGPDLDRVGSTVRIFGTAKSLGDPFLPSEMRQAEWALMGVASEAQLDLALPKRETFEPPDDATPTPRLIARLPYATASELRDYISAAGLRLCNEKGKCKHLAKSALVDKTLKDTVRPALGELIRYEASSEPDLAGEGTMMIVGCTKQKALETCELCNGRGLACVPTGVNLVFEGAGKSRRLVEVRAWEAGP